MTSTARDLAQRNVPGDPETAALMLRALRVSADKAREANREIDVLMAEAADEGASLRQLADALGVSSPTAARKRLARIRDGRTGDRRITDRKETDR